MKDLDNCVLPTGKYKGRTFEQTPLAHLAWIFRQSWLKSSYPQAAADLTDYLARKDVRSAMVCELLDRIKLIAIMSECLENLPESEKREGRRRVPDGPGPASC